jgi:hypothetical protein
METLFKKIPINKVAINIGICLGYGIMIVVFDLCLAFDTIILQGNTSIIQRIVGDPSIRLILALLIVTIFPIITSGFFNKKGIIDDNLSFKKSFFLIIGIFNITPVLLFVDCTIGGSWCHGLELMPFFIYNLAALIAIIPVYFLYRK